MRARVRGPPPPDSRYSALRFRQVHGGQPSLCRCLVPDTLVRKSISASALNLEHLRAEGIVADGIDIDGRTPTPSPDAGEPPPIAGLSEQLESVRSSPGLRSGARD